MAKGFVEINKTVNEALWEAFAERGYSKEWITDPANEGRISHYIAGFFDYAFMVDGIPILSLVTESIDIDDDSGIVCKFRIKQY